MEPPIHARHKTSEFAPEEDLISTMPDNVLTNILDRLPLLDAARTAILASNWRFKWTLLLSQLVFDWEFFSYLRYTKAENHPERVIGRILLQLRGAITKCVFSVNDELAVEDEDIIHWISFLSRKGIKDLTLEDHNDSPFKLPIHLFSCLELKHLKLYNCCFNPPPTFHGFPNLLSLQLGAESGRLEEVITRCPLLEILKLNCAFYSCKVKLDEIAKLENLKVLSLSLCNLDTRMSLRSSSTIIELLGPLPKLQQLELDFGDCKLIEAVANKRSSIAFPCLKALTLRFIDLRNGIQLSCAFELIRSCPNLQTLQIIADLAVKCDAASPPRVDYNAPGLLQLQSVVFEYLKGSENELCFIKYLLSSSPVLKKLVMRLHTYRIGAEEKFKFAGELLKLHRASPVVDIKLS